MSWPEVKKINSDFMHEPLNFNNYINDISTFGKYSYVLDPENSKLWRSLICQSLTMFGHSAIHDTVYERLNDEDVDYMLRHNVRLGQAFNSFYSVSDFASGRIDSVLRAITAASYNVLDLKFQSGINRYVSEKTSGNTAGEWLGTVFGIDALKTKTDMVSIFSDTTLWNDVITVNESLRYVVCLSSTTIDWFANNDSDAYITFINEVCNSTKATMDLFVALDGNNKLAIFMNTESVVTVMVSKAESMIALSYVTEAFSEMISNSVAMNIVAASDTAVDVIIDGITNVSQSDGSLSIIKRDLSEISEQLNIIPGSAKSIVIIDNTITMINSCLGTINDVNNQADTLAINVGAILASETAMNAIAASETAMNAILASETAMNAIAASETAMNAIAKAKSSITLSFWISVNKNLTMIRSIFNTVKSSAKFSNTANLKQDSVSALNNYGNTANTIIFVATGYYSSNSEKTNVFINGTQVSSGSLVNAYRPTSVSDSNVGAIAVPKATFTELGDGYASISVYMAL